MNDDIADFFRHCQQQVDQQLQSLFADLPDDRLSEAMRYSVLNGGKRIRPALCYAAAELFGAVNPLVHRAAMAVELIHAYSLIHDDLPAMDDDDLRRGKPTCHIAFDEATAILAGDALQTLAFDVLSMPGESPDAQLAMIHLLAQASGAHGMVLGQSLDMAATSNALSLSALEHMHRHKTGALIRASVLMGATASLNTNPEELRALEAYSAAVGLAFQVQDDILDVVSTTSALGKRSGADSAHDKSTYTSLLGLDGAREKLTELHQDAVAALADFGERGLLLHSIADFIVERSH